jgi:endonuclease/exonuclease/phosphatase family metal-dependent hydrolase
LRKALVVDVEMGDFDFFLIAVHLKAGRSSEARKTRTRQCRVIREFVKTLTEGAEKDVLIVGDYNMVPVEDDTNFAAMNFPEEDEATSFLRFVTTEELAAGTFSHISSGGRPGALLDGFAISTNHTGEYVPDSIEVVPMHERLHRILRTYARDVSDHLPVIASFRTTEDDDGE